MCTRIIPSRCWHVAQRAHFSSSTVRRGMVTRRTDPINLVARCKARSFRATDALPRTSVPACSETHSTDSPRWQGRFSRSEARKPFFPPLHCRPSERSERRRREGFTRRKMPGDSAIAGRFARTSRARHPRGTGRLHERASGQSSRRTGPWFLRIRILNGHSLTQRTETAICFWPRG